MKNIFKKLSSLLLGSAMLLGVGVAISSVHNEAIETRAESTTVTLTSANSVTENGVTISFAKSKGSNDPIWVSDSSTLRLYAKNTITFSSDTNINKIEFTWEKNPKRTFATVTADVGSYTHPSAAGKGTWEGASKNIVFTVGASGQIQLTTLVFTLEEATSNSPLKSIVLSGQTTSYYTDDEFSFDGTCTATFEDDSTKVVTPTSITKPDMSTAGEKTIEVSYTDPNDETNIKTASYTINVTQNPYEGKGTKENPYTVSDVYTIANGLESDTNNGKLVYAKGVVSGDVSLNNSRGTFNITDGKQTIKAYSITGVNTSDSTNSKYVADQYRVVITGTIINYNGTLEIGYASGFETSLESSKAPATLTIDVPDTLNLNADGTFNATTDATNPTVVWSSSDEDFILVENDATYLVGDNTGKVTVTATLTYDNCIIPITVSKEVTIIDPNAHQIVITGDTSVPVDQTIQLTATCVQGDAISWLSSSDSIATVSNDGKVSGVSEGNVVITARCANGASATHNIEVTAKQQLFAKVTSTDDLVIGKEFVIADIDGKNVMSSTQNDNNRSSIAATKNGDYIVKTDDTAVFTLLPAKDNGYAFYDKLNNAMLASASSDKNYLHTDGKYGNENAYANISISTTDGETATTVTFQGENSKNTLKKNSNSSIFSCYSKGQTDIAIYIAVEGNPEVLGDTWAKEFNSTANCDATGVNNLEQSTWDALKSQFEAQSIPEKMAASYLDVDSSLASEDFKKAINNYEHCLAKYQYTGFINNRDITVNSLTNKFYNVDNTTTIAIIVVISLTSLTAIGGYLFIRKHKEQ